MQTIRITVLDEEEVYVQKLAAFLNRYGKGRWMVSAFTDRETVCRQFEHGLPDVLLYTTKDVLQYPDVKKIPVRLFLSEETVLQAERDTDGSWRIFRYQGASRIGNAIMHITETVMAGRNKPMLAIYSPIGRCGKTSMVMETIRTGEASGYVYIGMEDYAGRQEHTDAGAGMYYLKQHTEDRFRTLLEAQQGILIVGEAPADTRQITEADLLWMMEILQNTDTCQGAFFDIGTGILANLHWLRLFDRVVVPYLSKDGSYKKLAQFRWLLEEEGYQEILEKSYFLDVSGPDWKKQWNRVWKNDGNGETYGTQA